MKKRDADNNEEFKVSSLFNWIDKLGNMTSKISKRTNDVEGIIQALKSFNLSANDKGLWKTIFSTLAGMNFNQATQTQEASTVNSKAKEKKIKDDNIAEWTGLIGSEGLQNIVKEVMSQRSKKKRRRKKKR